MQVLRVIDLVSELENDAGYLTAEADTLDSVTDRGSTTTNPVTVGSLSATVVAPATPAVQTLYEDSIIKVWLHMDGDVAGSPAILDDVNVSSITDNGVGLYTINFATAMANANYAAVGSCDRNDGIVAFYNVWAVGSVDVASWDESAAAYVDPNHLSVIIVGNN